MSLSWIKREFSSPRLLLNPNLPKEDRNYWEEVWLMWQKEGEWGLLTSGTTGRSKLVFLNTEAFWSSAKSVCRAACLNSEDVFLLSLPLFHVAGASIVWRARLLGARILLARDGSIKSLLPHLKQASVLSLVPTQLYDLVEKGVYAPQNLRVVFIGGDHCDESLLCEASSLGWPWRLTYGMTEAASQIALSDLNSKSLKILPHMEVRLNQKECLEFRSPAMLSGSFSQEEKERKDLGRGDWFSSRDRVQILKDGEMRFLGRDSDFVKVNGEGVSILEIEGSLVSLGLNRNPFWKVLSRKHSRKGAELILICHSSLVSRVKELVRFYNDACLPVARIIEVIELGELPKTLSGKVCWRTIETQLQIYQDL